MIQVPHSVMQFCTAQCTLHKRFFARHNVRCINVRVRTRNLCPRNKLIQCLDREKSKRAKDKTRIAVLEVRLEGGGAAAEGVVRFQASGVDPDETLQVVAQKETKTRNTYMCVNSHTSGAGCSKSVVYAKG